MSAGTIGAALIAAGIVVLFSPFIIVSLQGMAAGLLVVILAFSMIGCGYGLMHGTGN